MYCVVASRPPCSALFPYTTLFRSDDALERRLRLEFLVQRQQHVVDDEEAVARVVRDESDVVGREPQVERVQHPARRRHRSEEHTSELQSRRDIVCRLLLETKNR